MNDETVARARKISEEIAAACGAPRFYREKFREVAASSEHFETHPAVRRALAIVTEDCGAYGHGLSHARKVAIDAGALILIEEAGIHDTPTRMHHLMLAHLAGLLHDICRGHRFHARTGAERAEVILCEFDLTDVERKAIGDAIRNHEAFQPAAALDLPWMQMLSDVLYDADKFRWGPDNFTEMLWDIVAPIDVPMKKLLAHYLPGLEGLTRIRGSFRSRTGKEYGPEFIDLGLIIGRKLYDELVVQEWPDA